MDSIKLSACLFVPILLVVVVVTEQEVAAADCTITQFGGPTGPGQPCKFPFKLNGVEFDRCTIAFEGDERPWCPTKTDDEGNHAFGSRDWGYCDPACPFATALGTMEEGTTSKPRSTIQKGATKGPRPTTRLPTDGLPAVTTTTTTTPTTTSELSVESHADSLSGTWMPKASAGECGISLNVGFVVGGAQARRGEFPFMALLGYRGGTRDDRMRYRCGGTLINRLYVLTAAHCHMSGVQEITEVVLGEHDIAGDPDCERCRPVQRFLPAKVIVHDTWLPTRPESGADDIALVRLDRPASTVVEDPGVVVLPVCLGFPVPEADANEVLVAGWGRTTNAETTTSVSLDKIGVSERTLQKLNVPLVDFGRCKVFFPQTLDSQLCAGGEAGKDSCNGDSGGPLLARQNAKTGPMFLIGIVSSGTRICGSGLPGIYTKVSEYKQWILEHLEP